MKKLIVFVAIVVVGVLVSGCEDRTSDESCVWGCFPDTGEDVVYDDTTGEDLAEPDESPPTISPDEYCSPYLGVLDCECTGGECDIGNHIFYVIELVDNTKKLWTMSVTEIGSGSMFLVTCDPKNPPPTDSWSTNLVGTPPYIEMQSQHPNDLSLWFTLKCQPPQE